MGGIGIYSEEAELLAWLYLPRGIRRGVGDYRARGGNYGGDLGTRWNIG